MRKLKADNVINMPFPLTQDGDSELFTQVWLCQESSLQGLCLPPRKDALVPLGSSRTEGTGCCWRGWLRSLHNLGILLPALSVLTCLKPFG